MKIGRGRYWIFAFHKDRPIGGLDDFKFSFNKVEEFEDKVLELTDEGYASYQLLDSSNRFIFEGDLGTITKWVCKNIGDERYEEDIY